MKPRVLFFILGKLQSIIKDLMVLYSRSIIFMRLGSGGLYCFDPTHSWSWPRHHFQLNLVSDWNPILHFLKNKNKKKSQTTVIFKCFWLLLGNVLSSLRKSSPCQTCEWEGCGEFLDWRRVIFSLSLSFFCWQVPLQLQSRELPENDAVNKWMGGLTSVTSLTFQFILIHDSVIVKCRL